METKAFHDVDIEGNDSNNDTRGLCGNSIDDISCDGWIGYVTIISCDEDY